jgi:hypothetical protein
VALSRGFGLPAATRNALEMLTVGGKGAALRKKLLALRAT